MIPDIQVAVVRALYDLPKNCELTVERFDINATYAARLDISFSENIRCSCMLCKSDAKTEYDLRCRLVEEVYPKLLEDFTMDTSHPFDAKSERGFCRAKEWIRSWMQLERKVMSTYGDANKWLRTDLAPVRKGLARAWYLIDMKKGIEVGQFQPGTRLALTESPGTDRNEVVRKFWLCLIQ